MPINKKRLFVLSLCVTLGSSVLASSAVAQESTVKQDAKKAGREVGSAVRKGGQAVKKVPKAIGHAAKEGVGAVKEGGREFKKAVKGEN